MIKYFFAALTIPDKDIWVNLSPYEKDRMVPVSLGQTAMGRDLLAQDYMLKQLTASLIYPQKALGKTFWDTVYSKAKAMYGTTQIPVNTFNKVWIVPQRVGVYEHNQTAFIVNGHLKVMLEEDYLSLTKHNAIANPSSVIARSAVQRSEATKQSQNQVNKLGSQIIRQIILPEIEKEINEGKNFATLRQIFYAQVLAVWFKRNLKQALLNRVYANKGTVKGIDQNDAATNEAIYRQYLKAYKKGVFNYIKEDIDPVTQETLPRKYFSGGYNGEDVSKAMVAVQLSPVAAGDAAQKATDYVDIAVVAETDEGQAKVLARNVDEADAAMQAGTLMDDFHRLMFQSAQTGLRHPFAANFRGQRTQKVWMWINGMLLWLDKQFPEQMEDFSKYLIQNAQTQQLEFIKQDPQALMVSISSSKPSVPHAVEIDATSLFFSATSQSPKMRRIVVLSPDLFDDQNVAKFIVAFIHEILGAQIKINKFIDRGHAPTLEESSLIEGESFDSTITALNSLKNDGDFVKDYPVLSRALSDLIPDEERKRASWGNNKPTNDHNAAMNGIVKKEIPWDLIKALITKISDSEKGQEINPLMTAYKQLAAAFLIRQGNSVEDAVGKVTKFYDEIKVPEDKKSPIFYRGTLLVAAALFDNDKKLKSIIKQFPNLNGMRLIAMALLIRSGDSPKNAADKVKKFLDEQFYIKSFEDSGNYIKVFSIIRALGIDLQIAKKSMNSFKPLKSKGRPELQPSYQIFNLLAAGIMLNDGYEVDNVKETIEKWLQESKVNFPADKRGFPLPNGIAPLLGALLSTRSTPDAAMTAGQLADRIKQFNLKPGDQVRVHYGIADVFAGIIAPQMSMGELVSVGDDWIVVIINGVALVLYFGGIIEDGQYVLTDVGKDMAMGAKEKGPNKKGLTRRSLGAGLIAFGLGLAAYGLLPDSSKYSQNNSPKAASGIDLKDFELDRGVLLATRFFRNEKDRKTFVDNFPHKIGTNMTDVTIYKRTFEVNKTKVFYRDSVGRFKLSGTVRGIKVHLFQGYSEILIEPEPEIGTDIDYRHPGGFGVWKLIIPRSNWGRLWKRLNPGLDFHLVFTGRDRAMTAEIKNNAAMGAVDEIADRFEQKLIQEGPPVLIPERNKKSPIPLIFEFDNIRETNARGDLRLTFNVYPFSTSFSKWQKRLEEFPEFEQLMRTLDSMGKFGHISVSIFINNNKKPVLYIDENQATRGFWNIGSEIINKQKYYRWVRLAHQRIIQAARASGIDLIYARTAAEMRRIYPKEDISAVNLELNYKAPYQTKYGWEETEVLRSDLPFSSGMGSPNERVTVWQYVGQNAAMKVSRRTFGQGVVAAAGMAVLPAVLPVVNALAQSAEKPIVALDPFDPIITSRELLPTREERDIEMRSFFTKKIFEQTEILKYPLGGGKSLKVDSMVSFKFWGKDIQGKIVGMRFLYNGHLYLYVEGVDAMYNIIIVLNQTSRLNVGQRVAINKDGVGPENPRGGIDLSQQDAALRVTKDANGGVVVNVDPALIARIEREGMPEVVPVIINMRPADIRSLFGVGESV